TWIVRRQQRAGLVGRSIIHHDDFLELPLLPEEPVDLLRQNTGCIEGGGYACDRRVGWQQSSGYATGRRSGHIRLRPLDHGAEPSPLWHGAPPAEQLWW